MFLEKTELKTKATEEIINKIINNNDIIVDDIILESIDVASTYLYQYYDTEVIFSKVGDARSRTLLKHIKSLVIYEIYKIRKIENNQVKESYDEAMLWLEKVSEGKIKPNLPVRNTDTDGDGTADAPVTFLKLGSNKNYKNHF